ncbi:MAG: ATPase [Thaumarchaeota archaeon S14]|nr:MAG: ATPase [Thaumarchaeota archaeon S14]
MLKVVADSGAMASGEVGRLLESGELRGSGLIVPVAAIDELHAMAATGDSRAERGLAEIAGIQRGVAEAGTSIRVVGEGAPRGEGGVPDAAAVAAIVRRIALESGATLCTASRAHALAAEAAGVPVRRCRPREQGGEPWFFRYFDDTTMSVHLKEGQPPRAKRGRPGAVSLVNVAEEPMTRDGMAAALSAVEALAAASGADISLPGALVVQHDSYRIAATFRPFSEASEITIVHPTVALSLADYDMPDVLRERLAGGAEGILVSGAPGSGKSTLASALANHYHASGKTVKTFESPRDLQVDAGVTQYSRLDGDFANSADVLLLVRPDYTIFDEVRRREDFEVFADLRLAGVGMLGVVHASSPIDAIQRFIGKIELGIIPHVLDTVAFVEGGRVGAAYSLALRVKVPSGMTEQDLARPVIEIHDLSTGELSHEIYAFGEENMIVPVEGGAEPSGVDHLACERVREVMRRFDHDPHVEVVSPGSVRVAVSKGNIAPIIGRGGSNISALERELHVHIDVVEAGAGRGPQRGDTGRGGGHAAEGVAFEVRESRAFLMLEVERGHAGDHADIYVGDEHAARSRVDHKGRIRIPRHSGGGREVARGLAEGSVRVDVKSA